MFQAFCWITGILFSINLMALLFDEARSNIISKEMLWQVTAVFVLCAVVGSSVVYLLS